MIVSEKRLAANRANAAKSTGPRTARGKSTSSRNATKHGLFSRANVIDGESPQRFNNLVQELHDEFQPATSTEEGLVQVMAVCRWRLLREWTMGSAGINHEVRRQADSHAGENLPTRAALAMRSLRRGLGAMSVAELHLSREHHTALRDLLALQELREVRAAKSAAGTDDDLPAQA